jgi:hypothetical protein
VRKSSGKVEDLVLRHSLVSLAKGAQCCERIGMDEG